MSGLALFLALFGAALLSSAITCLVLWVYYRRVVEPAIDRHIDSALKALGEEIGGRVRRGVVDGVTDLTAADTFLRTTEKVASRSAALMDEGLNVLLGKPRKKP